MRNRLKLWMVPIILVVSFALTTCVVAAFAQKAISPTQCIYGTIVEAREVPNERYVMRFRIMAYRDQVADSTWAFPDAFICTRR